MDSTIKYFIKNSDINKISFAISTGIFHCQACYAALTQSMEITPHSSEFSKSSSTLSLGMVLHDGHFVFGSNDFLPTDTSYQICPWIHFSLTPPSRNPTSIVYSFINSSGKCSNLGQLPVQTWKTKKKKKALKKILIFFSKKSHPKQIFYTFLKIFFYSMDHPRADIIKNVLYSDSLCFLHSRKKISILYIIHEHIGASFLFLLQKDFYIAHKHTVAFCLFLLQKDFTTFQVLLFGAFLCFLIIVICDFYI